MRALAIRDGNLQFEHLVPEPAPAEDEVLIRPLLAGVCNTDLELVAGYNAFEGIIGHEFVGMVEDGPPEWQGKRVVGEINIACGTCDFCLAGVPSHCRTRRTLGIHAYDGVFAEAFVLPVHNLHAVPDGLSDEQAVFVEPLAAACQVLEMAHIRPTDNVVLIGAGKLGLLTAQVLRLTGAALTVVARHDYQMDLLEQWHIPAVRDAEMLRDAEILPAASADVVVDCTGNESGFASALKLLKARGKLVLKSTYHGLPQVNLTRIAVHELVVIGSRCGPFESALRLLDMGLVDVTSMITARFPLAEAREAIQYAGQPGILKVLLAP